MLYFFIIILILVIMCTICDCYGSYKFFKSASKGPYFENNRIDY